MFDREGKEIGTAGPPGAFHSIALSPDETRLLAIGEGAWLVSAGQIGRLNLGKGWELWSRDGLRLIGRAPSSGRLRERAVGSSEVGEPGETQGSLHDISADGEQVLATKYGIFAARLRGTALEREPVAVVENRDEGVSTPGVAFLSGARMARKSRLAGGEKSGRYAWKARKVEQPDSGVIQVRMGWER